MDNQACNCTAAANLYKAAHPEVGMFTELIGSYLILTRFTVGDAFEHYLDGYPHAWHCEVCPLPLPAVSDDCGCIAAGADYVARYPEAANYDPLFHYKVIP